MAGNETSTFASSRRTSDARRLSARRVAVPHGTKCKTVGDSTGQRTFKIGEMDADHIVPWSKGGKTTAENCQMLCIACNRSKGDL